MRVPKSRNFFQNIIRKARINLLKIYYARGSAHEIALGAAIGAFWGVFPTFGLSTILSLLMYKLFRFNLVVAISAAFISNPLTSPFLLWISYKVGTFFITTNIQFEYDLWYQNLSQIGYVMLIGSALVSFITAIFVFFVTKFFITHSRKRPSANT
jgi:uncharacterized protein (DUF2062 family)